jgi:hypothetical protein
MLNERDVAEIQCKVNKQSREKRESLVCELDSAAAVRDKSNYQDNENEVSKQ